MTDTNMMERNIARVLLILTTAGMLAGCDLNRHTGQHGQIVFEYYSDKDPYNFNKPIIEGGYLDLFLYDVGDERPTEVQAATSLDPDIARIEGHVANLIVVQGLEPGRARIEVRALDGDGLERSDTIAVRVDKPQTVRFHPGSAHVVNGGDAAVHGPYDPEDGDDEDDGEETQVSVTFHTGDRVEIPWTRTSANNEPLVGYGVYPVEVEPEGAAKIHDRLTEDDSITVFMPDEPQTFELGPAMGYRGDRLVIEVVEPDAVDEAFDGAESVGRVVLVETGLAPELRPHRLLDGRYEAARPSLTKVDVASIGEEVWQMAGAVPWWRLGLGMLFGPMVLVPAWIAIKRRKPA